MIKLYKPYMPELPKLNEILNSEMLGYGQYTKEFENKLKAFIGNNNIIVTNTFSSAIQVVVKTLGLVSGDEIIMSPVACLNSTMPYLEMGLKIKWCDIDPQRGTLCPKDLLKKISFNTKAIIHNHFCGYPGYIDEINSIARKFKIYVVDDGIEAFGSEYKGKKIGNCGTDVTIFSFSSVRNPNTIDGGAIFFNNEELLSKSIIIRDNGIDRNKFRNQIGEINKECDISVVGYNAMMSNLNGYIGSIQMDNINNIIREQRKNAIIWDRKFLNNLSEKPIKIDYCKPNYWIYGILSINKDETINKYRNLGYYASSVHVNNNIYSVFKDSNDVLLPGVEKFVNSFVALPSGWWVANE